jgi:hypothetical protein
MKRSVEQRYPVLTRIVEKQPVESPSGARAMQRGERLSAW